LFACDLQLRSPYSQVSDFVYEQGGLAGSCGKELTSNLLTVDVGGGSFVQVLSLSNFIRLLQDMISIKRIFR
jgi:hypothetical protein